MRYVISERKIALAVLIFAIGIILISQASLFASPVLVSEKSLLLIILGVALIVSSVLIGVRAVRKILR